MSMNEHDVRRAAAAGASDALASTISWGVLGLGVFYCAFELFGFTGFLLSCVGLFFFMPFVIAWRQGSAEHDQSRRERDADMREAERMRRQQEAEYAYEQEKQAERRAAIKSLSPGALECLDRHECSYLMTADEIREFGRTLQLPSDMGRRAAR